MSDYYQSEPNEQDKEAARIRGQELKDLTETFTAPAGRRVFWRLLTRCHYVEPVSRPNSGIYRLAAERDLGLFLISELTEADPALAAQVLTMGLKEHAKNLKQGDGK